MPFTTKKLLRDNNFTNTFFSNNMNKKNTQKLICSGCIAIAIAFYSYLPNHSETKVTDYAESSGPADFDLLGTKIFAPKKPTKLSNEKTLERYLTQHN